MGTRSLTIVKEGGKDSDDICVLYGQMDGYPDGLGAIIKRLFGDFVIVNGLQGKSPQVANGMSCFAAQLITQLKNEHVKQRQKTRDIMKATPHPFAEAGGNWDWDDGMAGQYYLYPAGTRDCGESYLYTLYLDESKEAELRKEYDEAVMKWRVEGDRSDLDKLIPPAGILCLMVEYAYGDKVVYDGPLADFDPKARDPNLEDDDE